MGTSAGTLPDQELVQQRIQHLETSQKALQSHLTELEAECSISRTALQNEQDAKTKAEERVDKLLAAKKRLQESEEGLKMEIACLEVRPRCFQTKATLQLMHSSEVILFSLADPSGI